MSVYRGKNITGAFDIAGNDRRHNNNNYYYTTITIVFLCRYDGVGARA